MWYAFRRCIGGIQKAYQEAGAAQDPPPELLNALIYRITIKRILARQLEMTEEAIASVQVGAMTNKQPSVSGYNDVVYYFFRACGAVCLFCV